MTSETGKRASLGGKASAFDGEMQFGVTADNYPAKAKAFILAHGNQGFVVANRPTATTHVSAVTLRQWGAWLSYFRSIGKKGYPELMERQGYFTVPAEWPHLFDADATVQGDNQAADGYEARERERVRAFNLPRAARDGARSNNIWPQIRREKFEATPDDHLRKREWWEDSPEREKLYAMGLENFPDRVPVAVGR